jgi:hypothetical protein
MIETVNTRDDRYLDFRVAQDFTYSIALLRLMTLSYWKIDLSLRSWEEGLTRAVPTDNAKSPIITGGPQS